MNDPGDDDIESISTVDEHVEISSPIVQQPSVGFAPICIAAPMAPGLPISMVRGLSESMVRQDRFVLRIDTSTGCRSATVALTRVNPRFLEVQLVDPPPTVDGWVVSRRFIVIRPTLLYTSLVYIAIHTPLPIHLDLSHLHFA